MGYFVALLACFIGSIAQGGNSSNMVVDEILAPRKREIMAPSFNSHPHQPNGPGMMTGPYSPSDHPPQNYPYFIYVPNPNGPGVGVLPYPSDGNAQPLQYSPVSYTHQPLLAQNGSRYPPQTYTPSHGSEAQYTDDIERPAPPPKDSPRVKMY